jgi:hypothetical protein
VSAKLSSASRAQRFNLQLPLKYRLLGESVWRWRYRKHQPFGNVVPGEETIPLNAQLEINLVPPAEIAGLSPAAVICHGEVVRTVWARLLRAIQVPPGTAAARITIHGSQLHYLAGCRRVRQNALPSFNIQFLEIQFLRCPEGIEYSRHRPVHPRHQCRGFSRWIGNGSVRITGVRHKFFTTR